jgi:LysM repeat protein
MTSRRSPLPPASLRRRHLCSALAGLAAASVASQAAAQAVPNYPITEQQRSTARQVADAGVPLSELSPNAPDAYTVKRGDTLWDISKLFLRSPWRWPELWGMNLSQIRNPHLIYPGQQLFLDKSGGRARLRVGQPVGTGGTVKLSPRARPEAIGFAPISALPLHLIEPFLNEAVIFETNELEAAPRIVATQEGRVVVGRGETAYVRGDLGNRRDWRVFRAPKPLRDPATKEILGYEAAYVGTAEYTRPGGTQQTADGKTEIVPATFNMTSVRQEAGVGDRLAPVPPRDFDNYVPRPPTKPIDGQIVSLYGEALTAGQNQIVVINRGTRDGVERGHVLALLRSGERRIDRTYERPEAIKLPDEERGYAMVFRVFDRMSYALVMTVQSPVSVGDRIRQP